MCSEDKDLITPNSFVHTNAYMCLPRCLAMVLTTRLDSQLLQLFFLQCNLELQFRLENKESCMDALLACDVAASSASVLWEWGRGGFSSYQSSKPLSRAMPLAKPHQMLHDKCTSRQLLEPIKLH